MGTECRRHKTNSPACVYIIHCPGLLCVYAKYQKSHAKTIQSHDRKGRCEEKEAVLRKAVNGKLEDQKNGSRCPELCLVFFLFASCLLFNFHLRGTGLVVFILAPSLYSSKQHIFKMLLFHKHQIRKAYPNSPSIKVIKTCNSHKPGSILLHHQALATVRGCILTPTMPAFLMKNVIIVNERSVI